MHKRVIALALAGLVAAAATPVSAVTLPLFDSQGQQLPTLAPMVERTVPGVVNIFSRTRVPVEQNPLLSDPFFRHFFNLPDQPRERQSQSLGSGVIVDAGKGYILTNNHVVDRADEVSVSLHDGRSLKAKVVGSDPDSDIAVLQVPAENLTAVPLADSGRLRQGDFVVAIGNPFGLGHSVTSGVVSALGRHGLGIQGYEDFIQTDASINPGNSGGALVNLRGELVGINNAILSKSGGNMGIGFAIPINMARDVMEQLVEHGQVHRGKLGVASQDLTPELAGAFGMGELRGAVIAQVEPGSAAEQAGLQPGDIVTEINGRAVASSADLRNAIGMLRVGQKVELRILRNGERRTLSAQIKAPKLTKVEGAEIHPRLAGAVLGGEAARAKSEGVPLLEVERGSPAARAGLQKGDIILQANRQPVSDLSSLREAVAEHDAMLLNIRRGNGAMYLLLR